MTPQRTYSMSKIKQTFSFLFIFWLVSSTSFASSISGFSGTVSQGQTITISGSGFGSGDTSPLCFDDFEAFSDDHVLTATDTPLIGGWAVYDDGNTSAQNTQAHSGSISMYSVRATGYNNFSVEGFNGETYAYFSWWQRWNGQGDDGQVKIIQFAGTTSEADWWPSVMFSRAPSNAGFIAYANGSQEQLTNKYPVIPVDTWHFLEFIGRQSSAGSADGTVIIRLNGTFLHNDTSQLTRSVITESWNNIRVWYSIANSVESGEWFIDDVYVNNSLTRVVIGPNQTYADNTGLELCPASSWADGLISARVNVGALTGTAYLWVIDANNVPSDQDDGTAGAQGYALTIGSSQSGGSSIRAIEGCIFN